MHRQGKADPIIRVVDLVKTYPDPAGVRFNAIDGLSFMVARGEVFALVGPNGAGKTTTLEILEGLTAPTGGTVEVLGMDVRRQLARVKQLIGVQLQSASYFEYLTLEEILRLFGSFYQRSVTPEQLLARVGLLEKRRALVAHLSGGQAQRFSIVAALVNDPELVFLDEPTTGLDPQARRNLWELIRSINRVDGKTVILTTHYMEEAEVLSDRVAIMDHGRFVALGAAEQLVATIPHVHRVSFTVPDGAVGDGLDELPGVLSVAARTTSEAGYELVASAPQQTVPALFTWANERGLQLRDVRVQGPTLEDVFLERTGEPLRE